MSNSETLLSYMHDAYHAKLDQLLSAHAKSAGKPKMNTYNRKLRYYQLDEGETAKAVRPLVDAAAEALHKALHKPGKASETFTTDDRKTVAMWISRWTNDFMSGPGMFPDKTRAQFPKLLATKPPPPQRKRAKRRPR